MASKRLSNAVIRWAYDKWCLGYTLGEIAECLGVAVPYLSNVFKIYGYEKVNKRPRLEYPFKTDIME